ncbi:hypothetical protein Bhyg_05414 [Pseudolycoriella hygida]|uniref:Uncharacterized protein n=1 Tax=Pseudolycoriella hygida TaxID=35572 RepID=A0A9Q0S960_9DIPT|nr:hypothetical protein Bhyg_05414 [Pseudolycoriella hygida]
MTARVVATKERKYGGSVRRDGSPIPGVEIFNVDIPDVNIADKLLAEGLAEPINPNISNGNYRSENVLRLDGGDDRLDPMNEDIAKENFGEHNTENDTFSGATKKFNANKQRIEINTKNSSSCFIDMEKQNGNKMPSENDNQSVDTNLNRSHPVA